MINEDTQEPIKEEITINSIQPQGLGDLPPPQNIPIQNPESTTEFGSEPLPMYPTSVDKGTLTINAIKAFDLVPADANGYSDPYLVFKIGDTQVKTKVLNKTLNPEWNEILKMDLSNITQSTVLEVKCYDKDKIGKDDFLGETTIFLAGLVSGIERQATYPLEDIEKGSVVIGLTADFSLQDFPPLDKIPSGTVRMNILGANNLVSKDINGKSDPYAVIIHGECTNKTKTIEKELNPRWNETFELAVTDVTQMTVIPVMVFDHDSVGSDDFIGIAFVPLAGLFEGDSVRRIYPLHGVKHGEIEIECSSNFNLPDHSPILHQEVVRKASQRTKTAIKQFLKVQKNLKNSSNSIEKQRSRELSKQRSKQRIRSAKKIGKKVAKGIGKGLLLFGAIVLQVLVAIATSDGHHHHHSSYRSTHHRHHYHSHSRTYYSGGNNLYIL